MRNIIEELYYGNICPMDRQIVKGGDYSHLLHLLTRNEDSLTETLTQDKNDWIEWWLYEDVEKLVSWEENGEEVTADLTDPEDLWEFLESNRPQ